jgi:hypothetical protein
LRGPRKRGGTIHHGVRFNFADPASWPAPAQATTTVTTRYGLVRAQSWKLVHTKLIRWAAHWEPLPIVEGTVIRLQVERLPCTGTLKPLWPWHSTNRDLFVEQTLARLMIPPP